MFRTAHDVRIGKSSPCCSIAIRHTCRCVPYLTQGAGAEARERRVWNLSYAPPRNPGQFTSRELCKQSSVVRSAGALESGWRRQTVRDLEISCRGSHEGGAAQ
jgi:hypothetical protein